MPPENRTDITRFPLMVSELREKVSSIWNATPEDPPDFRRIYSVKEQSGNERALEKFLEEADRRGPIQELDAAESEELKRLIKTFLSRSFGLSAFPGHGRFFDSCWKCVMEFIQDARRFDPSISDEDIGQALRNLLIVNSIQAYLGLEITLTPSAFAYSLLYPYTDNYLDSKGVPGGEKRRFILEVRRLLSGGKASFKSPLLAKVADLISIIEAEYPRGAFPDVYGSFLAIHDSQEKSLLEHHSPEAGEILAISIEKGGTSVLADACLVTGNMSAGAAEFMFGYGAALQMIDDLQDMAEDGRNSHRTIFTPGAPQSSLEATTNRLFTFTRRVLGQSERFPREEAAALADFSLKSCSLLMFEAVARAGDLYSAPYLAYLERSSQLGFAYLGTLKDRLERRYLSAVPTRSAGRRWDRAARLFSRGRARKISL